MASKYRLEVELVLDEKNAARAIEVARAAYNAHGSASALLDGREQPIPSEQFIHSLEQLRKPISSGDLGRRTRSTRSPTPLFGVERGNV